MNDLMYAVKYKERSFGEISASGNKKHGSRKAEAQYSRTVFSRFGHGNDLKYRHDRVRKQRLKTEEKEDYSGFDKPPPHHEILRTAASYGLGNYASSVCGALPREGSSGRAIRVVAVRTNGGACSWTNGTPCHHIAQVVSGR